MATTLDSSDSPVVVLSRPAPGQPLQSVYLEVDAAESENHASTSTITDHPVERGPNISDHSRPDPEMVTAEITISNTPISISQQTSSVSSGGFTFQVNAAGSVKIGDVNGYAQQALAKLRKMKDEGTVCTVVTSKRTYRSMLIQSITRVETAKTYDALVASIVWKQVFIVDNQLTTARVKSKDVRAQPKQKKGEQTGGQVEDQDTLIKRGVNKLITTFGGTALSG